MIPAFRDERFYNIASPKSDNDTRSASERDRDRILYASSFRRLAGVTQVVNPAEGYIFHNRLTHTLEVAQVARRLAEKLQRDNNQTLIEKLGGVDPNVVEAAALAHDLGHPPFGHVAEEELDHLALSNEEPDGFEGNAQSFRIICRLAVQKLDYRGLNLTRATLNAVLKYPWFRATAGYHGKKFGAYHAEEAEFHFARERYSPNERRSLEAWIMDYADDVAYSVHDLDDLYRAGLIPLDLLTYDEEERRRFLSQWQKTKNVPQHEVDRAEILLSNLLSSLPRAFSGTARQRGTLRTVTSDLIQNFIHAVVLQDNSEEPFIVDDDRRIELKCLKGLVWVYVINNPRLATQQYGQRQVIRKLFEVYYDAVQKRNLDMIPHRFHRELDDPEQLKETRLAVDVVASFTDDQALNIYRRLIGISPGSVIEVLH